jgi:cysteine-rich repeat protein
MRRALLFVMLAACGDPNGGADGVCGDGVVQAGEACDDGNHDDDDDCLDSCELAFCGDRDVDVQGPDVEECDEGGIDTATCNRDCTRVACGDGYVNAAAGETCDDSNWANGDGCSARCNSDESCGNGIVDSQLPNNRENAPSLCLDSETQGTNCAEVCDDGNNVSGDGCSRNCLSEETCPNGIRDPLGNPTASPPLPPEVCDDGNQSDLDKCAPDCQSETCGLCGNGCVDPLVEECDNGTGVSTSTCDSDCTVPICGDGTLNVVAGETCDPGMVGVNTPLCDHDCTLPVCGDDLVNRASGEQCEPPDQGNCSPSCQLL